MLVRSEDGRVLRTYDIARLHKNGQSESSSDFGLAQTEEQKRTPTIFGICKFLPEICSRVRKDSKGPHEVDGKRGMDVDGATRGSVCRIEDEDWRRGGVSDTGGRRKVQSGNGCVGLCDGSSIVSTTERRDMETSSVYIQIA